MGEMMTAEMTAKVAGPKHAKLAQRQGNRHGSAPGSVVLGGRRVPVERPRGRSVTGDDLDAQARSTSRSSVSRGSRPPLGLWLGDTENKTVVTALLADLVARGLNTDGGLLVVIDGAKALAIAVRKVVADTAFIQRCTLHKRRNVCDRLPKDQQGWVDRRRAAAFNHDDPAKGERACRDLAAQLEARWPDAAASLREGLEDMFTVRRLGVGGRLAASLTNTNCIESMISIARDTTKNVKRWRDGKMIKRWCAAGMLNAERSFRRLKGYRQMPTFVAALARHVEAVTPACDAARVA
jgi:putative transposase